MDATELFALSLIHAREYWKVEELRSYVDIDVLRALDIDSLIEVAALINQRGQGGASVTNGSWTQRYTFTEYASPSSQPFLVGRWDVIFGYNPDERNPGFAVRATDKGRVMLARESRSGRSSLAVIAANIMLISERGGSPADEYIVGGRLIEEAIRAGAFDGPLVGERIAIEERLSYPVAQGRPHPYVSAWKEAVGCVRQRRCEEFGPGTWDVFMAECVLIANELVRQASQEGTQRPETQIKERIGPIAIKPTADALGINRRMLTMWIRSGTIAAEKQSDRRWVFCRQQLAARYPSTIDKLIEAINSVGQKKTKQKRPRQKRVVTGKEPSPQVLLSKRGNPVAQRKGGGM